MPDVFKLQQLLVSDESAFAEFTQATGSLTWAKNLPILEGARFELEQMREPDQAAQSRLAKRSLGHKGVRRGRVIFSQYWQGHGSDPTGALTETHQQQLLGDGLGGNDVGQSGGTVSAGASTTSLPFSVATLRRGGIVRVGSSDDARGQGQPTVLNGAASPVALLTALPAAPNAGDVIRVAMMAYFAEGATQVTKRFCGMHKTTGAQFVLFGCELAAVRFTTPIGGKATIEYTYEGAYWDDVSRAFPDALALEAHDCAPIAGGGILIQDVGVTARTVEQPAELELTVNLGLQPQVGQGGAPYQYIQGWVRDAFEAKLEVKIPWKTAYRTWWDTENPSLTKKQILWWANTGNGRSFGFYMPNAQPVDARPIAPINVNGQLYVNVGFEADEGADTTNDLTRSSLRLWAC